MTKIKVEVSPTENPNVSYSLEYTKELVEDLEKIVGLNTKEELNRILQAEADALYEVSKKIKRV